MAKNMQSIVGRSSIDNLYADNMIFQNRKPVILPTGATVQRGMVLVVADDRVTASLPTASTTEIDCVLLDFEDEITLDEDTPAAVAWTGEFNENAIIWGDILPANQDAIIKNALQKQIDIKPMVKAPFVQFGEV